MVVYHNMGSRVSARAARAWCAWLHGLALRPRSGAAAGVGTALAAPPCLVVPSFPGFSCPRM
jgi:hypothetical protein